MDTVFYYKEMHLHYYGCSAGFISASQLERHFRPVEDFCIENGISIKHFIEAQFSALSEFFKKKNLKRFPLNSINTSEASVQRYNKFLEENKLKTGSIGVSKKDVAESRVNKDVNVLQLYVMDYLKNGNKKSALKIIGNKDIDLTPNKEVAVMVLYRVLPIIIPYVQFKDYWQWSDLRQLLIDLGGL